MTRTDLPDSNYTTATYQVAFHAMTSSTDERGYTTTYAYDGSTGHLLTVENALHEVTTYGYDGTTGRIRPVNTPQRNRLRCSRQ